MQSFRVNGDLQALARDKALLKLTIQALKECIRCLEYFGNNVFFQMDSFLTPRYILSQIVSNEIR